MLGHRHGLLLLWLFVLFAAAAVNRGYGNQLLICDFDSGILTAQSGTYSGVYDGDSMTLFYLDDTIHRGVSGRSLKVSYLKTSAGACRLRINLFDDEVSEQQRRYLNVSRYPYLSMWVKGLEGGEDFVVGLSDPKGMVLDIVMAGQAASHYAGGITADWKKLVIPVRDFGLKSDEVATLTIDFNTVGQGTIFFDDLAFEAGFDITNGEKSPAIAKAGDSASPAPSERQDARSASRGAGFENTAKRQTVDRSEASVAGAGTSDLADAADCSLLPVWNFDTGIETDQGGYYNQFQSAPSTARLSLFQDEYRGKGGRSLRIRFDKGQSGFCGVWLHLFDDELSDAPRKCLNVTEYPFVSFWVKGEMGGEDFRVQMADEAWLMREDSKPGKRVSDYLGGPVTNEWREVVAPYRDFRLFNYIACCLVFNFTEEGVGTVYVDDISFKKYRHCEVPLSEGRLKVKRDRPLARAMWVWDTQPLLFDPQYRTDFFDFCANHGINELFLQLPYRFENDLTPDVSCVIQWPDELRGFIGAAHAANIRVHALDGYPEFVLTDHHPRVLAQVRAIVEFNRESEPGHRYYGIHLDNEPYQLLGFEGPYRESILTQYLELNQKIMNLLREYDSALVYGVDIPFWFDEASNDDGTLKCNVAFNGKTQDAAKHIIDIVDNVGIMNYRNFAGGADGMIKHGYGEIQYAEATGKKIYLGVETFKYEPVQVSFIFASSEDRQGSTSEQDRLSAITSRFENFQVRELRSHDFRLLGLVAPGTEESRTKFHDALGRLYSRFGITVAEPDCDLDDITKRARSIIAGDPRYSGFQLLSRDEFAVELPSRFGFTTTEIMLDKITFAGSSKSEMEEALKEVAYEFQDKSSFIGFAIHYYKTYRHMPD